MLQQCSITHCQREPQYSIINKSYYENCPYHGLNPPVCLAIGCLKVTEFSTRRGKFYKNCPKHGGVKAPKCAVRKCNNITEFSPTMGIYFQKCPDHGLPAPICTHIDCDNKTKYNYSTENFNIKCNTHLDNFSMGDKIIRVCEEIENNVFYQWISKPFTELTKKEANKIQPQWENYIMAKNRWLTFWFELGDIAKANDISIDACISRLKYLEKKEGLNLMHADLIKDPKAIRFANNNQDILYDKKTAKWIHKYLNTYTLIY